MSRKALACTLIIVWSVPVGRVVVAVVERVVVVVVPSSGIPSSRSQQGPLAIPVVSVPVVVVVVVARVVVVPIVV